MIVGVGLDLVDIAHFKKIIEKGGVAFYKKILTPMELKEVQAMSTVRQINFGAKRYAVKEAFAKACGTGIGKFVGFKDITVVHDKKGCPDLKLSPKMKTRLKHKFGDDVKISVSLADDKLAGAVVILSRD
ncbi:MAG: holo-ACP synthase [Alphaproteobacteria bacterium]|nr:holo-ACP synthase [Alphaproteobacteria bacterium]